MVTDIVAKVAGLPVREGLSRGACGGGPSGESYKEGALQRAIGTIISMVVKGILCILVV